MKQLTLVFFIALFSVSCNTSSKLITSSGPRDGSSYEKAIIVKSIAEEYKWVKENYPGYHVTMQALVFEMKKPYDVLSIQNQLGDSKKIYFDISKFYGKMF